MRTTTRNGRLLTLALAMGTLGVLSSFPGPLYGQAKPAKASDAPQQTLQPTPASAPAADPFAKPKTNQSQAKPAKAGSAPQPTLRPYTQSLPLIKAKKATPAVGLSNLAQMLDAALKHNPDIRVAESHRIEAEAELNRVRLQITQKVMRIRQSWEAQRHVVSLAEVRVKRLETSLKFVKQLRKDANPPASLDLHLPLFEIEEGKINLTLERAKLAEIEAELPYLLGQQPTAAAVRPPKTSRNTLGIRGRDRDGEFGLNFWERAHKVVQPTIVVQRIATAALSGLPGTPKSVEDKIRKALGSPTQLDFIKTPFKEVLEYLIELHSLEFVVDEAALDEEGKDVHEMRISIRMRGIPLAAALQAIEDKLSDIRFVVRDYGILVTLKGHEPDDGLAVREFWKGRAVGRRGIGMEDFRAPGMMGSQFGGGRRSRPSRAVAPTLRGTNPKRSSRGGGSGRGVNAPPINAPPSGRPPRLGLPNQVEPTLETKPKKAPRPSRR